MNFATVIRSMKTCGQSETLTVLEHGYMVKNYLFDLIEHLETGSPLRYEWKLPNWVLENKERFLASLPSKLTLKRTTIMHDCGKPYCIVFDDEGKRHFPNHAQVSYNVFKQLYDDGIAAELILHDMDIHLLKADGVEEFSKNKYALVHLIIGLSEIHANASMFGGIHSTSFKIKYKSIDSRGKALLAKLAHG